MTTRISTTLGALICATALGFASIAAAQPVPSKRAAPEAAAPTVQPAPQPVTAVATTAPAAMTVAVDTVDAAPVAVEKRVIEVGLNRGLTLQVPADIDEVVFGEESILDFKQLESGQVFLFGRAPGATNMFLLSGGRVVFEAEIFVQIAADEVEHAIKTLLPDEHVRVEANRETLYLTGNVRSPAAAADAETIAQRFVPDDVSVVNLLSIKAKQQVILRVKVAEIVRTAIKELGASYLNSVNIGGFTVDLASGMLVGGAAGSIAAIGSNFLFDSIRLNAMEQQGLVKVLSEPTLTSVSGETATMLAGGEFPSPTGLDDNGNLAFEFKPYGVRLSFTPVVLDAGRINIEIATEVSSLGEDFNLGGYTTPGLLVRRANTNVDLPSGGSLMMAGLLQESEGSDNDGIPGMKDVPILGALFRKTGLERIDTELVIIVSAYLAKPVDATARLAAPTDGFGTANDLDIYLLGKLHKEYAKRNLPPWATTLKGPYGYIME